MIVQCEECVEKIELSDPARLPDRGWYFTSVTMKAGRVTFFTAICGRCFSKRESGHDRT